MQPMTQPVIYEAKVAPVSTPGSLRPQDVVEHDGGRYELRGDGMAVPYRWVWIRNPPAGPPGSAALRAPASEELAPARRLARLLVVERAQRLAPVLVLRPGSLVLYFPRGKRRKCRAGIALGLSLTSHCVCRLTQ